jgi:hypothetical protein
MGIRTAMSLVIVAHVTLGIVSDDDDKSVVAADDAGANNPADLEHRLEKIRKAGERVAEEKHKANPPKRPADNAKIVAAVMKNGIHLRGHDFAGPKWPPQCAMVVAPMPAYSCFS